LGAGPLLPREQLELVCHLKQAILESPAGLLRLRLGFVKVIEVRQENDYLYSLLISRLTDLSYFLTRMIQVM
jgi:hypothetical protein